ncbi:MAG: TldD/PmbA family protein [Candidatus Thorarchaeota archaeon]|nr:TldD/PmbA family protein [Candidatus Thorarchaeota archaeon]
MLDMMGKAVETIGDNEVSFADIRHQDSATTSIRVVNGDLRRLSRFTKAGTVARVLVGECWGQSSTTDSLSLGVLENLLSQATKIAKHNARHSRTDIDLSGIPAPTKTVWQKTKEDPSDITEEEKLDFVMSLDKAQKVDEKVVNTNSMYKDGKSVYRLANSEGTRLEWDEIRIATFVNPVAKDESRVQYDFDAKSGLAGYELIRSLDTNEFASGAAKGAVDLLSAGKAPSGEIIAVVDGDIAGLIAHEVCGHASEADEVVKKRSFLTGLVGSEVGTEQVSMIDDGSIDGLRGSYPFDSEGTPSSRTTIIENGIFKGYMQTLETAAVMGVPPTGNGRAQDYNRRIFARMSNTFFDKGTWKKDEIIEDTKDGIYIIKSHSGMEDVVGGGVQCTSLKGYLIKNGELTDLVRSMAITGKVLEILKTVDAVGDTLEFSGGTCGKGEEDWVPVTSGGPHMRMNIVVGGG